MRIYIFWYGNFTIFIFFGADVVAVEVAQAIDRLHYNAEYNSVVDKVSGFVCDLTKEIHTQTWVNQIL